MNKSFTASFNNLSIYKTMLEAHISTKHKSSDVNISKDVRNMLSEDEETNDEGETVIKEGQENPLVWTGTSSHNFIKINKYHRSQFELMTFYQGWNEFFLIQDDIKQLMLWFNKQFDDLFSQKEREMNLCAERNARLRHILKELGYFNFSPELCRTVILDPEWNATERPESIVEVTSKEVTVAPYISPSEQDLINKKAAEEERLKLLLLTDDFREKALITMMDGVLEKLWEDEIKKDVPLPKCMLDKDPEDYNEDDLRVIKTYEESVKFLQSERERYKKILEVDFAKVSNSLKESVSKFDERLTNLHLIKLKVESAIGQETLKILRTQYRAFQRMMLDRKEDDIKLKILENVKEIERLQGELSKLNELLNECKNVYENLQNRDKNLDKNFKKEFPDYSSVICEQLYKMSKKRPKLQQKVTMYPTVMNDLGRCVVHGTKPDYIPSECIEFLKGLDGLDHPSNCPPVVNEQGWDLLCKLRRTKIESEFKIRASALDLAEAETTVGLLQKNLRQQKEEHSNLLNSLQSVRNEKLQFNQNFQIQLVVKQGIVEVPTTGQISDFDEAVLINKSDLEEINTVINKVGMQKIKAMQKAANFRKGIIFKEWEHKKLRMEIEDLENHLSTVEHMQLTKELQAILKARARGFSDEKGFIYLENEITSVKERFERNRENLLTEIEETNTKIEEITKENEKIDKAIVDLNVDVNEQNLRRDMDFEKREADGIKKRMKMVVKRSRLVSKIQEQHNEILMLQTELELLRLRTFPTIKYRTV